MLDLSLTKTRYREKVEDQETEPSTLEECIQRRHVKLYHSLRQYSPLFEMAEIVKLGLNNIVKFFF